MSMKDGQRVFKACCYYVIALAVALNHQGLWKKSVVQKSFFSLGEVLFFWVSPSSLEPSSCVRATDKRGADER